MLTIKSPYNQEILEELPLHDAPAVEQALTNAYRLHRDQANWLPAWQRIEILEKTVTLMQKQIEALTVLASREGGKPYTDSKVEVERAINGVKLAAQCINQLKGEQVPMGSTQSSTNRLAFVIREPIGVVFSICAFNHPLNLVIHQTVTAIAAGCPVIIKPASSTPLSCLNFVRILQEAGLPENWCQVILCTNEIAEALVADERIRFLSFIGSAKVGWHLRSKLAPGTRCALEHGGAAPVIVEKDADLEELLPAMVKGGFYHAGQVCVSVQRIFVHKDISAAVTAGLKQLVEKLVTGDPLNHATEVGPLISESEVERVATWVDEAVKSGATLICGGRRLPNSCYQPTILLNPPQDAKVSTMEIFGPVICVYEFAERQQAIDAANSLNLHFQAAIFTKNIDVAMDCVRQLNATAVMINDHTAFRVDWMPFGGRDASGLGMGGIPYSIHEMTREKMMVIKSPKL